METIIIAIISLIGTLLGSYSGFKLTTYRVQQLEVKVEKHNQLIDRVYHLESKDALQDEKLEEISRAIHVLGN